MKSKQKIKRHLLSNHQTMEYFSNDMAKKKKMVHGRQGFTAIEERQIQDHSWDSCGKSGQEVQNEKPYI